MRFVRLENWKHRNIDLTLKHRQTGAFITVEPVLQNRQHLCLGIDFLEKCHPSDSKTRNNCGIPNVFNDQMLLSGL